MALPPAGSAGGKPPSGGADYAARQLEAMLLRQLWKSMRQTVRGGLLGEGPGASIYAGMMDDAMAEALAEAGGLGFAKVLRAELGGEAEAPSRSGSSLEAAAGSSGAVRRTEAKPQPPSRPAKGLVAAVAKAAEGLSAGDPMRWSRDGRLGPADLGSDFQSGAPERPARFNVRDAGGYAGENKCNLFVFEAARRAGLRVPLVPRARGWGYPTTNALVADAADGRLQRGWGQVVRGADAETLDAELRAGHGALLLVGSGSEGRSGHAALLERVRRVDLDDSGRPVRIEFDGWEARSSDGARRLVRRVWVARGGGRKPPGARGGLQRIEIIRLLPASSRERPEVPLRGQAPPSRLDGRLRAAGEDAPGKK